MRAWHCRKVWFRNVYTTSSLCVSERLVWGEAESQLLCGAQDGSGHKRDSIAWLAVVLRSHLGGPFQPCPCLGCAGFKDALLEPGFAILCLFCQLRGSWVLPDTPGTSAHPSALEELGLWETKLRLVVAAC